MTGLQVYVGKRGPLILHTDAGRPPDNQCGKHSKSESKLGCSLSLTPIPHLSSTDLLLFQKNNTSDIQRSSFEMSQRNVNPFILYTG